MTVALEFSILKGNNNIIAIVIFWYVIQLIFLSKIGLGEYRKSSVLPGVDEVPVADIPNVTGNSCFPENIYCFLRLWPHHFSETYIEQDQKSELCIITSICSLKQQAL